MNTPKALIFDLDGTLIHSAPDIHATANTALAAMGRAPLDLATIISFIGNGIENMVERCLQATGGSTPEIHQRALALFLETYAKNMTTLTRPYAGVIQALQTFRDAGIPLGICTNKLDGPARDICDQLALSPYFDVIAGVQAGQPKKPDATPLLNCAAQLGVNVPDTLYIGDSAIDFHTARNAKMPFRLFASGYLNDPLPELTEADRFYEWAAHGINFR